MFLGSTNLTTGCLPSNFDSTKSTFASRSLPSTTTQCSILGSVDFWTASMHSFRKRPPVVGVITAILGRRRQRRW
ncbi:hypothetical protein ATCV1_z121L [Acanthocystis turfacea chlorella virus 1]|uniref:Uncharacterized protein z121L n=1 Tax=Chlorovirus heliozoae TaxID=322019 RepID=A7K881_9PHYC|nr:hypothetical protein ATCV1_z121L [Acanthocystis turfacea chlorella virus 1]ABT16255.1 hypothetical protein ATCV1_z121L [Acanthocystis turfacea chlorella virus 1]